MGGRARVLQMVHFNVTAASLLLLSVVRMKWFRVKSPPFAFLLCWWLLRSILKRCHRLYLFVFSFIITQTLLRRSLSRYFHLKRMQSSTTNEQSQQSIRDTTTNKRTQKQRLNNEIQQLVKDIWRVGDPQKPQVPFGELFDDDDVQQHYEGLAATLKAAKKRKLFLCYCWW